MKKTPSHFTARVEIEQQISFFSFGFARVTEVRHIHIWLNFRLHEDRVVSLLSDIEAFNETTIELSSTAHKSSYP